MAKQTARFQISVDKIEKMKKLRPKGNGSRTSFDIFNREMLLALEATRFEVHPKLLQLLFRNALVNAVTYIEGLIKQVILDYGGKWSEIGIDKLMNIETTLSGAYNLFGKSQLSPEAIIAHHYSFSNYRMITYVVDTLTGGTKKSEFGNDFTTFEKTICELNIEVGPTGDKKAKFKEWNTVLKKLYLLRNQIIHEPSEEVELDYSQVYQFNTSAFIFGLVTLEYIDAYILKGDRASDK